MDRQGLRGSPDPWKFEAPGTTLYVATARAPVCARCAPMEGRRWEEVAMPTYEFLCLKCQKEFTVTMTIRERGEKQPACPICGSTELEPMFSSVVTKTSRKS